MRLEKAPRHRASAAVGRREDADDLMVLGHADVFNKYCLRAAPRVPFLSRAAVFYGGDAAPLAYTLAPGVLSHRQNI